MLVYDNVFRPLVFSVLEISMKRVVSNVCGLKMLNIIFIGFLIQAVLFIQCSDAVNSDQNSSADKLVFVHAVNKQTVRLISFQINQLKFLNFSFRNTHITKQLCRHSARNVIETFPTDPFKDEKYWDGGYGEITNVHRFILSF